MLVIRLLCHHKTKLIALLISFFLLLYFEVTLNLKVNLDITKSGFIHGGIVSFNLHCKLLICGHTVNIVKFWWNTSGQVYSYFQKNRHSS